MEKPTGSRIAVKRCTYNTDQEIMDYVMREDFRAMQQQQIYQMRQAQDAARRQRGSR